MITHKPYYKTGTGLISEDGKVIKGSGELLGYIILEVEPKDSSKGLMTFFVTKIIEYNSMTLEQADDYLMRNTRDATINAE